MIFECFIDNYPYSELEQVASFQDHPLPYSLASEVQFLAFKMKLSFSVCIFLNLFVSLAVSEEHSLQKDGLVETIWDGIKSATTCAGCNVRISDLEEFSSQNQMELNCRDLGFDSIRREETDRFALWSFVLNIKR